MFDNIAQIDSSSLNSALLFSGCLCPIAASCFLFVWRSEVSSPLAEHIVIVLSYTTNYDQCCVKRNQSVISDLAELLCLQYSIITMSQGKEYVLYGLNSVLQNLLRCADDSTNNAKSNNTTLSPSFLEASISAFPLLILNELTPRPNKSLSHNVRCLFVCLSQSNFLLERD